MMGGRDDAGGRIGVGRSEVEWWIREDGTHTHTTCPSWGGVIMLGLDLFKRVLVPSTLRLL